MLLNTVLLLSGGWTQALQLLAALSLLILLHEFGHFFFARLFKTRVEKFYLFFDFLFPFPGLLNFALFKKKKGDTEYGLGWFPLGGYVKISGMVDESMDKEQMALPPQPWEYRSKKAWQRLLIMLGGIIMNVLVAIAIYIAIFGIWGEQYLPVQNMKYGIAADSLAESVGFKDGDKIISVGGKKVTRFSEVMKEFIFQQANSFQVERDGQPVTINVPEGTVGKIIKSRKKGGFIDTRSPFLVGDVSKGTAADKIGLKEGDSIIALNNEPVTFFDQFEEAKQKNKGKMVTLTVVRKNNIVSMKGLLPADGVFGFRPNADAERYFQLETIKYGFGGSIAKGFTTTVETFGSYLEQFKFLFTSKEVKASESLGGIVSFGQMFPPVFSWQTFLHLTAFVSIILAFMNLLPIPGLDGGYVIFLMFELVTGRKVSDKVMERATTVGLVLLLVLMVYANGLDIFRLFKN
ncbi:MAG TPA: RIP metalloprotease RseP [Flavipsychrobacter sp.]|nr:RIP metalloprotease RseP [Flavipsychrobacter sp.]